jgi:hypothetical protein
LNDSSAKIGIPAAMRPSNGTRVASGLCSLLTHPLLIENFPASVFYLYSFICGME